MAQMLTIAAELEGVRCALVTLSKICLDAFALLSTVQHVSSSSKVHA